LWVTLAPVGDAAVTLASVTQALPAATAPVEVMPTSPACTRRAFEELIAAI
jgi:hypothetical protein